MAKYSKIKCYLSGRRGPWFHLGTKLTANFMNSLQVITSTPAVIAFFVRSSCAEHGRYILSANVTSCNDGWSEQGWVEVAHMLNTVRSNRLKITELSSQADAHCLCRASFREDVIASKLRIGQQMAGCNRDLVCSSPLAHETKSNKWLTNDGSKGS